MTPATLASDPVVSATGATLRAATIATPPGPFTVVVDADDAVIASGWAPDVQALLRTIGADRLRGGAPATAPRQVGDLGSISRAVGDYLAGDLAAIDAVRVAQAGTPFVSRAWEELRMTPAGAPQTYTQLAARCGRPAAVRAAASACARNTAALFVPCHRIVRTDGSLGGFLYGLDVKRWLIAHERGVA